MNGGGEGGEGRGGGGSRGWTLWRQLPGRDQLKKPKYPPFTLVIATYSPSWPPPLILQLFFSVILTGGGGGGGGGV